MKKIRSVYVMLFAFSCCLQLNAGNYVVSSVADVGPATLRSGITWANLTPGMDTISFLFPGPAPITIAPLNQLPIITDQAGLLIDGFSQPGSSRGNNPPQTMILMIYLDGINAGLASGLIVQASFTTIQGLGIGNFQQNGIEIRANNPPSMNNYVTECRIGTNITGTLPQGNGTSNPGGTFAGVNIRPGNCGMPSSAFSNHVQYSLISGNFGDGVSISSCPTDVDVYGNMVEFNRIGTENAGITGMGNQHAGIYIGEGSHNNTAFQNVISANVYEGVSIMGFTNGSVSWDTYANHINDNLIGLTATGSAPLGNLRHGVGIGKWGPAWSLGHATRNVISDNDIQHNSMCGVMVFEHPLNKINADNNRIERNNFGRNGNLGIDLDDNSITANDTLDPDSTANNALNFPVITSVTLVGTTANINGYLDIPNPGDSSEIEWYRVIYETNDSMHGEGPCIPGIVCTADSNGNFAVSISGVNQGDTLTAIARDKSGNTSEFALNVVVGPPVSVAGNIQAVRMSLTAFPNPSAGDTRILLNSPRTEKVRFDVRDGSGRLIASYSPADPGVEIPFTSLLGGKLPSPGVYWVTAVAPEASASAKVIILR